MVLGGLDRQTRCQSISRRGYGGSLRNSRAAYPILNRPSGRSILYWNCKVQHMIFEGLRTCLMGVEMPNV